MRLLLLLLALCQPASPLLHATQFGGVVSGGMTDDQLRHQLVPSWKQNSALTWVRSQSELLAEEGFNQVAILRYAPPETQIYGSKNLPDDLFALYWHCLTNLPARPTIRQAWEIWNEPDFHFVQDTPDRMAAAIKAAFWGIKEANPDAKVLMPSLAFNPPDYPAALARNGIGPYIEGYNFHFYGWAHDFLPSIVQHRKFMQRAGWELPMWVTECGYFQLRIEGADDPEGLARQQAFHERAAITAFAAGIDYYFPFILTPYHSYLFDMGLVDENLRPRPALTSYLRLATLLSNSTPRFVIRHKPSRHDIGVVLETSDQKWWTVIWSPYRRNDFTLPDTPPPSHTHPDETPELSSNTDPTSLALTFRFPQEVGIIRIGLGGEMELPPLPEAHFEVHAGKNLFLETEPHPFQIQDCAWRPIEKTPWQVEPRPDTSRMRARRKPFSTATAPSPAILQVIPDPQITTVHKPFLGYTYDSHKALPITIHLHNFSAQTVQGRLLVTWKVEKNGRLEELLRYRIRGKRLRTASISTSTITLELPPAAGQQPSNARTLTVEWKGNDGSRDRAELKFREREPEGVEGKSIPFDFTQFLPPPEQPEMWKMETTKSGILRLVLQEEPKHSGMASAWLPFPSHSFASPDKYLSMKIRADAQSPLFYRLNLVTTEKEAYRYTADIDLDDSWQALQWRLADFGPTFWSQDNFKPGIEWRKIRWLRLSVGAMSPGDSIELSGAAR